MAKRADAPTTFNAAAVKSLVGKIESYFVDIESERGKYMKRCRDIRERISAVYDEAKGRGIPNKELRVFVSARMKFAKARRVLDELEPEQRETVELLAEVFGDAADLPLFEARIKRAKRATVAEASEGDGSVTELRPH